MDTLTYIAEGIMGSLPDEWLVDRRGDELTLTWLIDFDYCTQVTLVGDGRGVGAHYLGSRIGAYRPGDSTPDQLVVTVLNALVEDDCGLYRYTDYLNARTMDGEN